MNKKEKILWILLIVIILLIIFILHIVTNQNSEQNSLTNISDILVEKQKWFCYEAFYYNEDGTKYTFEHNNFQISFHNNVINKCVDYVCKDYDYSMLDNALIIHVTRIYDEEYIIEYENNILKLEERFEGGTRVIYYLSNYIE